jgi:uncharacterized membrane protein YhfC
MIAMPLAVGAYLVRRFKTGWGLFLVGCATFIGSQILHIPFNNYVLNPVLEQLGFNGQAAPGLALAAAAILLGLSAGVFEEGARWLAYRFWIRRARTWSQGVVFGAGHGGVEAIIFGGLALATLIQLTALRGQDLAAVVPPEQLAAAEAQVAAYWALPGWTALFSPIERASAITLHITLSVIVLQAFLRRSGGLWLLAAIGWHALADAVAVFVGVSAGVASGSVNGIVLTEAVVAAMALISLVILFRLRPAEEVVASPPPPPPAHTGPLPPPAARPSDLEASRFTD